jgi:hypothetical protein
LKFILLVSNHNSISERLSGCLTANIKVDS